MRAVVLRLCPLLPSYVAGSSIDDADLDMSVQHYVLHSLGSSVSVRDVKVYLITLLV